MPNCPHFRFRSAPEEKISEFYTKIKVMTGHLFSLKNAKMVKKKDTLVVYRDFQKNDFGEKMPPKIYSVVVCGSKNGKY